MYVKFLMLLKYVKCLMLLKYVKFLMQQVGDVQPKTNFTEESENEEGDVDFCPQEASCTSLPCQEFQIPVSAVKPESSVECNVPEVDSVRENKSSPSLSIQPTSPAAAYRERPVGVLEPTSVAGKKNSAGIHALKTKAKVVGYFF